MARVASPQSPISRATFIFFVTRLPRSEKTLFSTIIRRTNWEDWRLGSQSRESNLPTENPSRPFRYNN